VKCPRRPVETEEQARQRIDAQENVLILFSAHCSVGPDD
jgi:hypothetical protein